MVYRKYGKRTYAKRTGLTKTQKRVVAKVARNVVKSAAERKYHDEQITAQAGSYDSALVQVLNDPAQGDGDTQREGDSIRMTSLQFRGSIDFTATPAGIGRLMIVLMKPGNRALGSASTITYDLDDVLQIGATSHSYISPYHHDNRTRFQVLYDRTFSSQDSAAAGQYARVHINKVIGLKQKLCQFDAASTRMSKNCIVAFWFSNQLAAGNPPTLDMYSRLNFMDV